MSATNEITSNLVYFGDTLISHNKLKSEDVGRVLKLQNEQNLLFGEAAKQLGLISEIDLKKELALHFNYPYIEDDVPSVNTNELVIQQNKQGISFVEEGLSKRLLAIKDAANEEAEAFRTLRSQLLIRWFDRGNKTLAITSAGMEDGAGQFVANLAVVFSQLNKKVLLIDANLRTPTQHQLFGVEAEFGLADILENIISDKQGSYTLAQPKALPNLSILTAGALAKNPQELLSTTAFAELLQSLENAYDIILIDTTPISLGADVLAVASKIKAVIIVTTKNQTTARELQLLYAQLKVSGAEILGSIFQEL